MLSRQDILTYLRTDEPSVLESLWSQADRVRREHVGEAVHLRGLVEFSNRCVRRCGYCGLNAGRRGLQRYRMTHEEVLDCAKLAVELGYGTVVLQSGEDLGCGRDWLAELIRRIKNETSLAVTLSVGERSEANLAAWREVGADRYLLRLETSDRVLFERLHPPRDGQDRTDRIALLGTLREIGYEIGSGVLVGLPGQSFASLADDLELFAELGLEMIGCGPFIAHPDTPLGVQSRAPTSPEQVPNTAAMGYKVVALARLICPEANIPSTTALSTLNHAEGKQLGLARGANVVMPNLTPAQYREFYDIYPGKPAADVDPHGRDAQLREQLADLGRHVATGPGDSPAYRRRMALATSGGGV